MPEAIVLDGEQRSALAVVRSLGARGVKVTVGAESNPCLSSRSRYCSESFRYPSPSENPSGFLQAVRDITAGKTRCVLIPITDVTLTEILMNRAVMPGNCTVPFADYDTYDRVTDKLKLFRLARDLEIPIPESLFSTDYSSDESLLDAAGSIGYPVVVKPGFSKIRTTKGWIAGKVHYAANERDLRRILGQEIFRSVPFLVQKRVEGPGMGVFLLMRNGEVIARFAHRRIREKPPSGGVSVLCESIALPAEAVDASVKMLASLGWTGVAMVEFKVDREKNQPKLLEINARFWGSLQLAIAAGVDFPFLLYRLSEGERVEASGMYAVGVKSRWELGDLDHLLIRLFKKESDLDLPSGYLTRPNLFKEFIFDFMRSSVKNEVFKWSDRGPFAYEFKNYIIHILS